MWRFPSASIVPGLLLALLASGRRCLLAADSHPDTAKPDLFVVVAAPKCAPTEGAQVKAAGVGILAVLVPAIIEKGLGLLGAALIRASGKDSAFAQRTAISAVNAFYTLPKGDGVAPVRGFGCVVISLAPSEPKIEMEGYVAHPVKGDGTKLFIESEVLSSTDGTAFRLVPTYISYGAFLRGKKDKPRDVEIRFDFRTPGEEKGFASGAVLLRRVEAGMVLAGKESIGVSTPWMPLRPDVERETNLLKRAADLAALVTSPAEKEQRLADLQARLAATGPTNIAVTITETSDYNKLLAAAGELLSDKKSDLARVLAPEVLPRTADQLRTEEIARLEALRALAAATAAVEAKEREIAALKAGNAAEADVRKAEAELVQLQYAANVRAVAAGAARPYPIPGA